MEVKIRLGDTLDDYCPKCRLLLNHSVATLVAGEVVKVVCRTCHNEHPYRHEQGGKKKKNEIASIIGDILARAPKSPGAPAPEPQRVTGVRSARRKA